MAEEDKLTIKLPKKASRVKPSNAEESKKIKIVLSKSETKAEPTVKSETKAESTVKSETKAEPTVKSEIKAESATKSEIKAEPATKSEISMASSLVQLKEHCKQLGIKGISKKNKTELLEIIKNHN
uniref:Rho termination factor N-terminal domain-containing protein n=1 Tax=viral metagenome TaxID=1070528 RepID=A0A6C0I0S4_9ZZZZ